MVRDDARRVDLAFEDLVQQWFHVSVDVSLSTPKRQTLCERGSNRKLVYKSSIYSGYGNRPALSTGHDRLTQRIGSIRFEHQSLLRIVVDCSGREAMGFHPHSIDAGIGSAAACQFLYRTQDIDCFVIQNVSAVIGGSLQAFREGINGNHSLSAKHKRAHDREQANRPASPDCDGIAGLYVAVLSGHVPGWQNVREEENLIVFEFLRNLEGSNISKWHTNVFRLSSRVSSVDMGITKEACTGLAI